MLLPIKIYPRKILRQKAKKVVEVKNEKIQRLILDMIETMKEKDGVGLAAPQVGQSLRIIVVNTQDGALALVNPRILLKSFKKELGEEGCLSFPKIFGEVKRPVKVWVSALDKDGKRLRFTAKGLLTRVVQHEVDHLNGVLFIDKMKKLTKGEKELEELRKTGEN